MFSDMFGFLYSALMYPKVALLTLAAFLISMLSSFWVNMAFRRYRFKAAKATGLDVAQRILSRNELGAMNIFSVQGTMSDHYSPRKQALYLSEETVSSASIASMAIAAHECGHAIQHHKHNLLFYLRWGMVPIVNLCSNLAMPIFLLGFLFSSSKLLNFGIIFFAASTIFYLITFPLEVGASKRGLQELCENGILDADSLEYRQCCRMLCAAAGTYFSALSASFLSLLKMIVLSGSRDRD